MKSVVLTLPDDLHTAVERAAQLEQKAAPELIVDVVANWLATRATPDTEWQLARPSHQEAVRLAFPGSAVPLEAIHRAFALDVAAGMT